MSKAIWQEAITKKTAISVHHQTMRSSFYYSKDIYEYYEVFLTIKGNKNRSYNGMITSREESIILGVMDSKGVWKSEQQRKSMLGRDYIKATELKLTLEEIRSIIFVHQIMES